MTRVNPRLPAVFFGDVVHNLHAYAWGRHPVDPCDWAARFKTKARELIAARDHALEEATENLERRGVRVLLCEARPNVLVKLTRAGLVGEQARKERYFQHLSEALRACSPDVR